MVYVDAQSCVGCGSCVDICPVPGAVVVVDELAAVDETLCIDCGTCVDVCAAGAMKQGRPDSRGRQGGEVAVPDVQAIRAAPSEPQSPQRFESPRAPRGPEPEGPPVWVRALGKVLRGLVDTGGGSAASGGKGKQRMQRRRGGRGGGGGGRRGAQ